MAGAGECRRLARRNRRAEAQHSLDLAAPRAEQAPARGRPPPPKPERQRAGRRFGQTPTRRTFTVWTRTPDAEQRLVGRRSASRRVGAMSGYEARPHGLAWRLQHLLSQQVLPKLLRAGPAPARSLAARRSTGPALRVSRLRGANSIIKRMRSWRCAGARRRSSRRVLLVHRQDQIEGVEVARAHRARAQRRQSRCRDGARLRSHDRPAARRRDSRACLPNRSRPTAAARALPAGCETRPPRSASGRYCPCTRKGCAFRCLLPRARP